MMESLGKKKFGIFIKALHRQAGDRQDYFVAGLFDAIGADKRIDISLENAVKNWVAGNNQSYKKRFKGKEFKQEQYNAFLKFLKEKINVRFKDVQSELKNYSAEYPYINFETDNQEVFFASVLNQFTEIVELPLPETARRCLKNGNVPSGEGFFRQARRFDAEILCVFQVRSTPYGGKKPVDWAC